MTGVTHHVHGLKGLLNNHDEFQITKEFLAMRDLVKGNFGDRSARSELVSAIVLLGAKLVDFYVFNDEIMVAKILKQFHEEFDRLKLNTLKLSYGDLLQKTKDALVYNLELRKRVKLTIKHVLVDEYQDTSPVQEDIIAILSETKNSEALLTDNNRIINQN